MSVIAGALGCYRKNLLLRLEKDYLNQKFLGKSCSISDDRYLTQRIQTRFKKKIYYQELADVSWLRLPQEPDHCLTNWQSYPVFLKDNAPIVRDRLMQRLLDAGISTRRGVMNAHQEKPYAAQGFSLKNSEVSSVNAVSSCGSLPLMTMGPT